MIWSVPPIWQSGDVWILGGGNSVVKQFEIPADVVNAVLSNKRHVSAYSPYMEAIHSKHVIGINAAFEIGTWIDMLFFGDSGYFTDYENKIRQFPNMKVSCATNTRNVDWVKYLQKSKQKFGISADPSTVCWNMNSGAAAINVAANAGAKRIFLLGFDMKLNNGEKHWHRVYTNGKFVTKPPHAPNPFPAHLKGFPFIGNDAHQRGIEIYNVSPDSMIMKFPKITLKEALEM